MSPEELKERVPRNIDGKMIEAAANMIGAINEYQQGNAPLWQARLAVYGLNRAVGINPFTAALHSDFDSGIEVASRVRVRASLR